MLKSSFVYGGYMEDVLNCYEIIKNIERKSYEDLEALLKNKNCKSEFVEGYLPRLFSLSYNIYKTYLITFTDNYNFEDFFYDAVEELIKLYDKWEYNDSMDKYWNFNRFTDYIRYRISDLLRKTSQFNISSETWKKLYTLREIKNSYFNDNGEEINMEELIDSQGFNKSIYCPLMGTVNYDELNMKYDIIEAYIDRECDKEAVKDITKLIDDITSERTKKIIYEYFGMHYFDRKSIQEIAKEIHLTRQMVSLLKKQSMDIIKNDKELKKKYIFK